MNEYSATELMEKIQMLMAQVAESAGELHRRGIQTDIMIFESTSDASVSFYRTEEVTPGKNKKK